jgi:hypothetical protein
MKPFFLVGHEFGLLTFYLFVIIGTLLTAVMHKKDPQIYNNLFKSAGAAILIGIPTYFFHFLLLRLAY